MKTMSKASRSSAARNQRGVTLIETLIAAAVLLVTCAGLMTLLAVSATRNRAQGEDTTRTVEYSQDKMEQLLALQFGDTASNTTVYPVASSGGTGLATGGGTTAGSPITGYSDYLDLNGNLSCTSTVTSCSTTGYAGPFYTRQWSIATSGNIKTISVVTFDASFAVDSTASTFLQTVKTNF